jgi:hypothetical protein
MGGGTLERTWREKQAIRALQDASTTHKLIVPALPVADESIASERGSSVGESSDDELDCSTDLLEAMLVVDPAVASALQAFTSTQNGVKTQGARSNVAYRRCHKPHWKSCGVKVDWQSQHQPLLQVSKPTQSGCMPQFNDGYWSCGASSSTFCGA